MTTTAKAWEEISPIKLIFSNEIPFGYNHKYGNIKSCSQSQVLLRGGRWTTFCGNEPKILDVKQNSEYIQQ